MLEVLALTSSTLVQALTIAVSHPSRQIALLARLSGFEVSWLSWDTLFAFPKICVLMFVLYASGDSLKSFGLRRLAHRDWITFAAAAGGAVVAYLILDRFTVPLKRVHPDDLWFASSLAPWWAIAVNCSVHSFSSELLFRGYLISRLEELTGSTTLAVLVPTSLNALLLYSDSPHYLFLSALAIVMALCFIKWRTI